MTPRALAPPGGSLQPTPQTSLAKLLRKNALNIRLISEPWPKRASAWLCVLIGIGTSGSASPSAVIMPASKAAWRKLGRPAIEESTSAQKSGTRQLAGIAAKETGMALAPYLRGECGDDDGWIGWRCRSCGAARPGDK